VKTLNLGIVLDQGADFNLIVGVCGASGPIDITGYLFKGQMRVSSDSSVLTPVAEFVFTILNQTTNMGQVQWSLPNASSSAVVTSIATALAESRVTTPFIFDVKMKDTSGVVSRIIQGLVYVSPQATQEAI
jgi:hypothetical protein